ncbi:Gfo/Idh/MocA family protein [Halobacillus naozhouensis]|uniref:Gfo/Idh/MocA family oxidoreductase n=1 Tax=Halobacillus naozhouensis TaxID=554880 RepID=A0ABY8IW27_9BACI|nr:Gfo/Idh/MocA family oxidoreductase [Halobacillus naozhouensis]WFT74017.1 Gfo/Idh/MocA family oxidoreductase [Halobacillus naozhouensis]
MKEKCGIVLVGIAGYGEIYLKALYEQNRLSWVEGVVDINPERSAFFDQIKKQKIPIYSTLESFYQNHTADLAIISTPIHLHAPQAITAMENGSHVLCEKPMTGSWEEAEHMRHVRNRTGRFVAIGFNWSFSQSVQEWKQDIQKGLFGAPIRGKTIVLWPRNQHYYNRSHWAGKLQGPNGEAIFDSIANNAASHFLHNLLYVLGDSKEHSAKLRSMNIELYRANPIETFDTCALRAKTDQSVELSYIASHAINQESGPQFEMEFEKATIRYEDGDTMKARWGDGSVKDYGDPETEHIRKLEVCIQAVLKGHQEICCGIEASYSQLLAIKGMHEAVPEVPAFPPKLVKKDPETMTTYVPGLAEALLNCYKEWELPSERGYPWAQTGKHVVISNRDYTY